ncbi:MAG: hypothetical protein H6Q18_898 [Bacteroidetes bacterium]|nr:hypothetical protein [Bacteroidota bacterium]
MRNIKLVAILAIAVFTVSSAKAQFATGADIVSSYVWRGVPQEGTKGTPNIQPYISFTTGALTVGSWASSSLLGNVKEVDLYATYVFSSQFAVTFTDYNWGFTSAKGYFDYSATTDHIYEATFAYTGPTVFPLGVSVNTMFAGCDTLSTGKSAFSTYAELSYPVTANAKVFLGASLFKSAMVYNTAGFAFTNIGVKVSKSIVITDKFSLPVYGILGANLSTKNYDTSTKPTSLYFVAGVTL